MPINPLIKFISEDRSTVPIAELKQHLIFYLDSPPGPKTVSKVLELYFNSWGDRFVEYSSTAFGSLMQPWNSQVQKQFEHNKLPDLRKVRDWGYAFSDGRGSDSWMLMFHGYKPVSEGNKASFYRFEFDWNVDTSALKKFTVDLLKIINCVSGNGGYVFQGQPRGPNSSISFEQIFLWAKRYWGVEVQDLDLTVQYMTDSFKCVNWLTIIGGNLAERNPRVIADAKKTAYQSIKINENFLFQASEMPLLGDQNRNEKLEEYVALARVLEPIQVVEHDSFGNETGPGWGKESTNAWNRRFTEPDRFVDLTCT